MSSGLSVQEPANYLDKCEQTGQEAAVCSSKLFLRQVRIDTGLILSHQNI